MSKTVFRQIRSGRTVQSTALGRIATERAKRSKRVEISSHNAMIDCIRQSLVGISEALATDSPRVLDNFIADYNDAYQYAIENKVAASTIRKSCETAYYRTMVICVKFIAYSVVDGNVGRRERLIEWYEDCHKRLLAAGFYDFHIRSRTSSRIWKGIR